MVTLYSTPTCHPCRAAGKALDAAGVAYVKVDLTEDHVALEALKVRTNSPVVHTPLFEFDGELFQIDGLRGIIQRSIN